MLCGLLRHSRNLQSDPPNFLDQKDARFKKVHGICDVIFRPLHENGVGADKKSAQIITKEQEDKLWKNDILNTITPDELQKGSVLLPKESLLFARR